MIHDVNLHEVLKELVQLRAEVAQLKGEREQYMLSDFSKTLESVLYYNLIGMKEPVFENPTTGRKASSIYAVLDALDYDYRSHWSILVKFLRKHGGRSVFQRTDLLKKSSWPTICVDLDRVEELLTKHQPRKAKKLITLFKEENNVR